MSHGIVKLKGAGIFEHPKHKHPCVFDVNSMYQVAQSQDNLLINKQNLP